MGSVVGDQRVRRWGEEWGVRRRDERLAEWADIAVPDSPARFDEDGAVSGFAEGFANAADGFTETLVVDVLAVPELIEELFSQDHAMPVFDEIAEDEVRLALKRDRAGAGDQQLLLWIKASRT